MIKGWRINSISILLTKVKNVMNEVNAKNVKNMKNENYYCR